MRRDHKNGLEVGPILLPFQLVIMEIINKLPAIRTTLNETENLPSCFRKTIKRSTSKDIDMG